MSSEHDRLLAEGPRIAPEPSLAEDTPEVMPDAPTGWTGSDPSDWQDAFSPAAPASTSGVGAGAPDTTIPGAATPGAATPGARRPGARVVGGQGSRARLPIRFFAVRFWLPILFVVLVISGSAGHGYAWVVPLALVGFAMFRAWRRQRR